VGYHGRETKLAWFRTTQPHSLIGYRRWFGGLRSPLPSHHFNNSSSRKQMYLYQLNLTSVLWNSKITHTNVWILTCYETKKSISGSDNFVINYFKMPRKHRSLKLRMITDDKDITLVTKHEEKRPLASTRLAWESRACVKMYLTGTLHKGVHWIYLVWGVAQCTDLMKTVIKHVFTQKARNFLTSLGTISF
jgi:hypothetical protein